jgi:hypothetical protein
VGAIDLTATLWREREALQAVLERQQELAQGLRADRPGGAGLGEPDPGALGRALDALEDAVDRLRPIVLLRDVEVVAAAEEWGAPAGLGLGELPRYAPAGPWGEIVTDHLRALRDLAERSIGVGREVAGLLAARDLPRAPRVPVSPASYAEPPAD